MQNLAGMVDYGHFIFTICLFLRSMIIKIKFRVLEIGSLTVTYFEKNVILIFAYIVFVQ